MTSLTDTISQIPLEHLSESPFNPRKTEGEEAHA